MKVIGLTGGIGTGKSTASAYLIEKGYPVLDADIVAREIVQPGMPLLKKLAEVFGREVLLPDGSLNRKALGAIVFSDKEKRNALDQLMHGEIKRSIWNQVASLEEKGTDSIVFIDAALLFETGMDQNCDAVWLITAKEHLRINRVCQRDNLRPDEVSFRISSQMREEEKEKKAQVIIENSGTQEALYNQLNLLLKNN